MTRQQSRLMITVGVAGMVMGYFVESGSVWQDATTLVFGTVCFAMGLIGGRQL